MANNPFISYGVQSGPNHTDSGDVIKAISKLGNAIPTTSLSLFYVSTELSASEAEKLVSKAMKKGDKLFIIEIDQEHMLRGVITRNFVLPSEFRKKF